MNSRPCFPFALPLLAALCFAVLAASPTWAEEGPPTPDLRLLMGESEFKASGLEKLSPEELSKLEGWIWRREQGVQAQAAEKFQAEAEQQRRLLSLQLFGFGSAGAGEPAVVESRIPGRFSGWSGQTVFTLENGQVWRQRHSGTYYRRMENPSVRITRQAFGYWLEVVDTGARVGVERVK